MTDRVVFHIGTEKTGSTSIQEGLGALENRLSAYGVKLCSAGRNRPTVARNVLPWRDLDAEAWSELRRELRRPEAGVNTLVVSNQALWRQRDGVLRRLRRYLDGRPAHVVLYVRDQAEFVQSLALQAHKNPKRAVDFDDPEAFADFVAKWAPDYLDICERFQDVLGADVVEARRFDESEFVGGTLLADLLSVLVPGVELAEPPNPRSNPSLTPDIARALRDDPKLQALDSRSGDLLDIALRLSADPRRDRFFLPEDAVVDLRARFLGANREFYERFLKNGTEFSDQHGWATDRPPIDDADLAIRVADTMHGSPRLVRGWRGRTGRVDGLFTDGWKLETTEGRLRARMIDPTATVCFRTDFERERAANGELSVMFDLESAEPSPMHVTVNGAAVGTIELTTTPVPLDASAANDGHWEVRIEALPGPQSVEVESLHVQYGRRR